MNGAMARLMARIGQGGTAAGASVLKPRVPSRFEPAGPGSRVDGAWFEPTNDVVLAPRGQGTHAGALAPDFLTNDDAERPARADRLHPQNQVSLGAALPSHGPRVDAHPSAGAAELPSPRLAGDPTSETRDRAPGSDPRLRPVLSRATTASSDLSTSTASDAAAMRLARPIYRRGWPAPNTPRLQPSQPRPLAQTNSNFAAAERRQVPDVRITIGRVEIRAGVVASPLPRSREIRVPATLSLADYVRERREGKR